MQKIFLKWSFKKLLFNIKEYEMNEDKSNEIIHIDTDKTKEASILCRFEYKNNTIKE
jgi:hypothetical protein